MAETNDSLQIAQAHGEQKETTDAHAADAKGEAHDATQAATDVVHDVAAAAHGAANAHHGRHPSHPPELPHFIQWWFDVQHGHDVTVDGVTVRERDYGDPHNGLTPVQVLHVGRLSEPAPLVEYAPWENNLFAGIAALVIIVVAWLMTAPFRRKKEDVLRKPTRLQMMVEGLVAGVDSFVRGVLGDENGRRYMPFIAGLFFFILVMNLMGMVPLMKAPTASIMITASLAITTFVYYFYIAMTRLGPVQLFLHLCGSPTGVIQWFLAPLMIIIECISFFIAKPLSLALRLYGNILGKDILFGVAMILGVMGMGFLPAVQQYIGWPLTYPFYFLGLLLSTIQALVFSLLSAIYIMMVLPHDHDHGHDDHGHDHDGHGAHAH